MNLETIKLGVKAVAEKYDLDFIVLFGSQATGKTHAKSDVDLAVIGRGEIDFTVLTMDFYRLFSREDVEVVDLAMAGPTLWQAVIRDGQLLYERERGWFARWKIYAWKTWLDTAKLRRVRDARLILWAKKHEHVA